MERGVSLYDPERHASLTYLYSGHDPGVCCRFHSAMARWSEGFPDRAASEIHEALKLAQKLNHPLTTAATQWFEAWLQYQRGEREAASQTAERLIGLADAHGFKQFTDVALVVAQAGRAEQPRAASLDEVRRQLGAINVTATRKTLSLCMLAELYGKADKPTEGRAVLASVDENSRQALYAPEILRVDAELILASGASNVREAEQRFLKAIEIARSREHKSFELRSATSLARLWARQHRSEEAHGLVSGVYAWFTEGFETADLRSARELLKELA